MVGRLDERAGQLVDLASFEAWRKGGREEEVINADAAVVLEGLAEEVPVGEEAALAGVQRAEGVDVAEVEHRAIAGAGLGLKEGVAGPGGGLVAIDVFGNDVEVAADYGRYGVVAPKGELADEAVHPVELVGELVSTNRVPVGQIDVDDTEAMHDHFEEAGMTIGLVAAQGSANGFERMARQDGDTVVGLLGDGGALIADGGEGISGEVGAFELLEQEEVGLVRAKPGGDVVEAGTDRVDVPGGDLDERLRCAMPLVAA